MSRFVVYPRPSYAIDSVDRALKAIQILRDSGALRLTEIARRLDTSPSGAHRLLAMLCYRGFAVQGEDRLYYPGPGIGAAPESSILAFARRGEVQSVLDEIALAEEAIVNIGGRDGRSVRLVAASGRAVPGLGSSDSEGVILPGRTSASGRAFLAELTADELSDLYGMESDRPAITTAQFHDLCREVLTVRRTGYAINRETTAKGRSAVAAVVRDPAGAPVAAMAITVHAHRFDGAIATGLLRRVPGYIRRIGDALVDDANGVNGRISA